MFHAFNPFKGEIDNSCNISHGGSFTGCEQMGFLWSMKQAPGQKKGLRLAKKDVTKPYAIQLNCFNGHLSPEEGFVNTLKRNHLQPITSSSLEKSYMADGVQRISVREGRVRATLFLPPGNGPFPGQCWSITSSSVLFLCSCSNDRYYGNRRATNFSCSGKHPYPIHQGFLFELSLFPLSLCNF